MGTESSSVEQWKKASRECPLFPEFVLIVVQRSPDTQKMLINIDERIGELISDAYSLPPKAANMMAEIERDLFEKFADNERRVWGELDPNTLTKYKSQQEELSKLHSNLEQLKAKIEEERGTQERLLREMRASLMEGTGVAT